MKSLLPIPVLFALAFFSSCDLFDDSPCGPNQTFDIYLLGSSIVGSTSGLYNSYLDGNNRVFQYSEIVENVCADEHVKIEARVALLDETTTGISATAGADWLFFFSDNFTMTKKNADLKGKGEIGLKQAFDKEPAWFVPKVEVFFPTKGSYSADTAFLKQQVISVELMAKYRKH